MLKLGRNKIYLTRGDTAILKVDILDANGDMYTPSATDEVYMTLRKTPRGEEIFCHTIQDGILMIDPEDTAELPYGNYVYDCELRTASGIVQTFIPATLFRVMEEVTY